MTFPPFLKRAFGSLFETTNLVSLTVLAVVSYLTVDDGLWWRGLEVEGFYLVTVAIVTANWFTSAGWMPKNLAGRLNTLKNRHESWLARFRKPKEGEENFALDQALLIITVVGFVVILFFGFGKHLLTHKWPTLTHTAGWEAGAIGWTFLFLIYYMAKFQATGNSGVDKIIFGVFAVGIYQLFQRAVASIGGKSLDHIPWVMSIALCFLVIDLVSTFFHPDKREKARSKASLLWGDFPMVFSMVVLFIYLLIHRDTEAPEVFVAGVIACQLLISNAIFVVMEFGLLGSDETENGSQRAKAIA